MSAEGEGWGEVHLYLRKTASLCGIRTTIPIPPLTADTGVSNVTEHPATCDRPRRTERLFTVAGIGYRLTTCPAAALRASREPIPRRPRHATVAAYIR